jgi:hypothetical protein
MRQYGTFSGLDFGETGSFPGLRLNASSPKMSKMSFYSAKYPEKQNHTHKPSELELVIRKTRHSVTAAFSSTQVMALSLSHPSCKFKMESIHGLKLKKQLATL